jgi:GTPase
MVVPSEVVGHGPWLIINFVVLINCNVNYVMSIVAHIINVTI